MTADEAEEFIPSEIDEMFNIVGYRREWEEENKDEE